MSKIILTIAGSEATGGAGAQADLKTFHSFGLFGIAALTCIVSFDPKNNWNHRFVGIEPTVLADQIEASTANYNKNQLDTVKIGMLGSPAIIDTTAKALQERTFENVILDPVLICKGQEPGHALDTDNALKEQILPISSFVTPNHFESIQLSGMTSIDSEADLIEAAKRIYDNSGSIVMAKGGVMLSGEYAIDIFYDGNTLEVLKEKKIGNHAVSGAGCTLAAAIASQLALGSDAQEAALVAKKFVHKAIENRVTGAAPFSAVWQG